MNCKTKVKCGSSEFIITNTLDYKMIYSGVSLLFSLTANSFDLAEITPACSSPPSISPARSMSSFISDPLAGGWSGEWQYVVADNLVKKKIFSFLLWVEGRSLSLLRKLYSSGAVIQLHPWPWSYCWGLNGGAVAKITVNAPLSTSGGLKRLSPAKRPGTLSAYWADSYTDIKNAFTCSPVIH